MLRTENGIGYLHGLMGVRECSMCLELKKWSRLSACFSFIPVVLTLGKFFYPLNDIVSLLC